jgi:hypothetical protein
MKEITCRNCEHAYPTTEEHKDFCIPNKQKVFAFGGFEGACGHFSPKKTEKQPYPTSESIEDRLEVALQKTIRLLEALKNPTKRYMFKPIRLLYLEKGLEMASNLFTCEICGKEKDENISKELCLECTKEK